MDAIDSAVDPLREFSKDSVRLVKRCHKPDRKGAFCFVFVFFFFWKIFPVETNRIWILYMVFRLRIMSFLCVYVCCTEISGFGL